MSDRLNTRVIQVTNIAPSCTKDQLRTLFGYLGRIKELEMFPPEGAEGVVTARVGYIEFEDNVTTGVALHLSSTVFIDRAITIVPVMDGKIPDESSALQLTPSAVAGMLPGQPTWPANVVSQVTGLGANQVIMTNDPRLTSLGLPQYPPLPATTDPSKIEEIRRTVFISDLDPKVTPEMLLSFFSQTGEIKYIRMAGDENGPTRNAYIEFTDQRCIAQALSYNNVVFQGRTVSVKHATTGIVKPSPKSEASQREIDDAMKKVKEASKLISAAANSERDGSASPSRKRSKSRGRSRSHSKSKRSRSRSRGRRKRSSSRTRRRSRSRRRSPRRSRSPRRRRSRSRGRVPPTAPPVSRRRSRTRSPVRRRRSRTRSKSKPRRSRTPPKSYSRGRRSHSRSRRSRSRERKEKLKERKKSMSPPTLVREDPSAATGNGKEVSPTKGNGRSPSPAKAKKRSVTPKRKTSRSRSPSRRKRRRSTSRKRTSRSRSASRHRSRKDKKRSRSRDRKHESSKKKSGRDKEEKKKESSSSKIKRDYDEEEKGFASEASEVAENSDAGGSDDSAPAPPVLEKDTDHQTVDMEMSD